MEGYTVQLKQQDKSSEEYRDREARAAQVAREIEGTTSSHLAAELENGDDDEEAAFSAVQRDTVQRNDVRDPDSGGKYITPARRQPSTSSNSGSMPGKHMNSGRHQTKGTPPPVVAHNQAHPGGNISNRSDRGGGNQHRGSIGNVSGAYGHSQGSSASTSQTSASNTTGSTGREHSG